MKLRITVWILLVLVTACLLYGGECLLFQQQLAQKTVRLHVLANSDGTEDQRLKLAVRDEILQLAAALTEDCTSAQEAQQCLTAQLDQLTGAAQKVLQSAGCPHSVTVRLEEETFSTRKYEGFCLPAGNYPALIVGIGAAEGKNWWCVVYPSLCTAAASDTLEEAALLDGYSQGELDCITEEAADYTLRFKTLEWLQKIVAWLR